MVVQSSPYCKPYYVYMSAMTCITCALVCDMQAELKGKKGLVPSNFLAELTPPRNDGIEVFAADEDSMRIADQIIQKVCV